MAWELMVRTIITENKIQVTWMI